jgi:hypothetical protein
MNLVNLLIRIIKIIQQYAVFDEEVFEFFEIDQKPTFYMGVFTLRKRK